MGNRRIAIKVKRNMPSILTFVGIGGMWVTAFMAARLHSIAKEKLFYEIEDAYIEGKNRPDLAKRLKTNLAVTWPVYLIGGLSTYCIVAGNNMHVRRYANLSGVYYLTQTAFHEYKEKVIENLGNKKEQKIRDEIAQKKVEDSVPTKYTSSVVHNTGFGTVLCCDLTFGTYFYSTPEKVKQAFLNLNEKLLNEMYMTVNDLYYELNIPPIEAGDGQGFKIENGMVEASLTSCLAPDSTPVFAFSYLDYLCPV